MSSKEYIRLSGVCHRESGWTEEEQDEFMAKIIEVVESYDAQLACSYELKTEEELDEQER